MKLTKILILSLSALLLSACGADDAAEQKLGPVAFENADECHVCGMIITKFPGPKGQARDSRNPNFKKFCSTKEMLIWYLQPENTHNVKEMYVHDMAKTPWESPKDEHLISARDAFYVIGSDLKGSMGDTLATFLSSTAAGEFVNKHGGEVIVFNGLTLELLTQQ